MESSKDRWKSCVPNLILAWIYISCSTAIARNIERYDTAYECDGKILKIECEDGELIHLIRANYGRFSITICNEHGNTEWSVNCMSSRSFRVLYNRCNQQQNCSIMASTKQFGDPCPNTLKYLEAHFKCISARTTTSQPSSLWFLSSQTSIWQTTTSTVDDKFPMKIMPQTHIYNSTDNITSTIVFLENRDTRKGNSMKAWSDIKSMNVKENNKKVDIFTMKPNIAVSTNESDDSNARRSLTSMVTFWKGSGSRNLDDKISRLYCPERQARNLAWNATQLGETVIQSCPGGTDGVARWQCLQMAGQPAWQRNTPDLSECRSVWLSSLEKRVEEGEFILGISSDLSQVTNNSRELYGGDIFITTNILKSMSAKMTRDIQTYQDPRQREVSVAELLQGAVTTGSNLLDQSQSDSWRDLSHKEQMIVATSLLMSLEENAFLFAETLNYEKNIIHERRNILMEVRVLKEHSLNHEFEVFPSEQFHRDRWSRLQDRVELTRGAFRGNENDGDFIRLVFMAFNRLEEILQPQPEYSALAINKNYESEFRSAEVAVTRILNSKVISASLGKGKQVQLAEPVRLYFQHLMRENVTNPSCVFWDYTTNDWSEEGCVTRKTNKTHTECECNHLTNFAVLMDINAVKLDMAHQMALKIITYIGCIVSVICLVLAIITFQLFQGLKVISEIRLMGSGLRCTLDDRPAQKNECVPALAVHLCRSSTWIISRE